MSTNVLFVSVNRSFDESMTLAELEVWVERAWAMSAAKASTCDRVIAVFDDEPIAAWPIRYVYPTDETYDTNGGPRPRIGVVLGEPLPVLRAYRQAPALRRGAAVAELDVRPLKRARA